MDEELAKICDESRKKRSRPGMKQQQTPHPSNRWDMSAKMPVKSSTIERLHNATSSHKWQEEGEASTAAAARTSYPCSSIEIGTYPRNIRQVFSRIKETAETKHVREASQRSRSLQKFWKRQKGQMEGRINKKERTDRKRQTRLNRHNHRGHIDIAGIK